MFLFVFNYFNIFFLILISFCISIILFVLSYLISSEQKNIEKISPYECGFNPFENSRNVFNVDFYIVGLLFLIFDIETIFIFPWVIGLSNLDYVSFWGMIDFFVELVLGFYYIWKVNSLDW